MRESISKVLVIGSGPIKIAEAAEFDYSGSQALKAVREEGIEAILVNPNVATIQTSYELADKVYLAPLIPEVVAKIIEKERPDGIMLGFGGQAALSLGVELYNRGVLKKYDVRVLGTPIEGIVKALNREMFRKTMIEAGLPVPPSNAATDIENALRIAEDLGYPVIVRVSFNLGGRGSFVAWSRDTLREKLAKAFAQSGIGQILVEKYLHHWKEVEFEVVRDKKGNVAAVACLENADPMGVHTGDSVVIAPCQTLTNYEYQLLRTASIGVADAISLVGECNVQLALDPRSSDNYYIIETNPRMSRSSALASKATGYPLAYIAAKLALGYYLHELLNKVTNITCSCFEPSLDYVVVKIPRWDIEKFLGGEYSVGSEMMSIGEVMAIGRNLYEAFQKAIRMLDIGEPGVVGGEYYYQDEPLENVMEKLRKRAPYWPLHVAKAIRLGASLDEIYDATGIDKYFLYVIKDIVELEETIREKARQGELGTSLLKQAKEYGFSDKQIAMIIGKSEQEVRAHRLSNKLRPGVKQIDTLAAEWPASTNYLYMTYNSMSDDIPYSSKTDNEKILVLGAGVFRIGVSVEFDWAVVNFAKAARRRGYKTIVLNYNPETVSTDWDMNEKLYFEEITLERVLDIMDHEKPIGVVVFAGGQLANNLAKKLQDNNVLLIGTSGTSIDRAENRAYFSQLVEKLGLKQPEWTEAASIREALFFAESVGYPVIVRPSYVLSGSAMKIAYSSNELVEYLKKAAKVSPEYPVVVSKFYENAAEAEIDAVSDSKKVVGVTLEHIERAGVHSGDSTMVTPVKSLSSNLVDQMHEAAIRLALELGIKGPFNIQFILKNGDAYVLELNLRSSRSMPFSSKSRGVNLMDLAAEAVLGEGLNIGVRDEYTELPACAWSVKSPQFSWAQLRGAYPSLGPEMKSTGEAASTSWAYEAALLKSWLSTPPNKLPGMDKAILVYSAVEKDQQLLGEAAKYLDKTGYTLYTLEETPINNLETIPGGQAEKMILEGRIGMILTSGETPWLDYKIRRRAADLNIPLVLEARLAHELSRAISIYKTNPYQGIDVEELAKYWCPDTAKTSCCENKLGVYSS